MEVEIEVTYLCTELPAAVLQSPSIVIKDIFVPANATKPSLRIRQRGDRYEITKKELVNPADASTQIEHTIRLTAEEFEVLVAASGRRIEKRRYLYPYNGYLFEIDVFAGTHAGLVLVEVEFTSADQKAAFVKPHFCGPDVTQEELIAGGVLSGVNKATLFNTLLSRYGYHPVTVDVG